MVTLPRLTKNPRKLDRRRCRDNDQTFQAMHLGVSIWEGKKPSFDVFLNNIHRGCRQGPDGEANPGLESWPFPPQMVPIGAEVILTMLDRPALC